MKPTKEQLADPQWWAKHAPEDAAYYNPEAGYKFLRLNRRGAPEYFNTFSCKWVKYGDKKSGYEHLFTATPRPQYKKQWGGPEDGLPPVGTDCIFEADMSYGTDWHPELKNGVVVKIIAHFSTLRGTPLAAFVFNYNGGVQVEQAMACCFHPLKSQEDLERERFVTEIQDKFKVSDEKQEFLRVVGFTLYDSGYRHRDTFAKREAELMRAIDGLAECYLSALGHSAAQNFWVKKAEEILGNAR